MDTTLTSSLLIFSVIFIQDDKYSNRGIFGKSTSGDVLSPEDET